MFMISPLPISLLKPGSVTRALPGVEVDIVDREGNSVPPGVGGLLVVTRPWPAMMTGLFNIKGSDKDAEGGTADERYREAFSRFPGKYLAGDVAKRDEDGYLWIQGRADDVLNIAGHRLGTAEMENAFRSHPAVAEAAIIGVPDKIKGEAAKAFIILIQGAEGSDDLILDLKHHMRKELGPVAVIKSIEFRTTLPRTRSGKILRRVLKAEELGEAPGDLSMLDDTE
jgi:acetyl-CoA synthetase